MKREGGMMRMSPVKGIVILARGSVEQRPGGYHPMLFGVFDMSAVGLTGTRKEIDRVVKQYGARYEIEAAVRQSSPPPNCD